MALHPQALAALELWRQGPSVADPGFGEAQIAERRGQEREIAAVEPREPVADVRDIDAYGVPARLYRPEGEARGAVVHAHGGGFVFGDANVHDAQARRLANRLGRVVLSVDYRRPPEHVFPAAHDDVAAAGTWLTDHTEVLGLDRRDLVAMGDSAGASLALVAALRHPGRFRAVVLVYPFVDPRRRGESFRTESDHGLSDAEAAWFWRTYAGPGREIDGRLEPTLLADPEFCPVDSARLGLLPPTQILVAEHDVLRDDALLLATRVERAGVPVRVDRYAGLIHGFWRHPSLFDAARRALDDTARFLAELPAAREGVA